MEGAAGSTGPNLQDRRRAKQPSEINHIASHPPRAGVIRTAVVLLLITPIAISSAYGRQGLCYPRQSAVNRVTSGVPLAACGGAVLAWNNIAVAQRLFQSTSVNEKCSDKGSLTFGIREACACA